MYLTDKGHAPRPRRADRQDSKEDRVACEDYPCCGHARDECPEIDSKGRERWRCSANRKTLEGKQPAGSGRAVQRRLYRRVRAFQCQRQPVVSVDTPRKRSWSSPFRTRRGGSGVRASQAEPERVHDFLDKALGKAIPYGVYDLTHDAGWVSVGVDHDTAYDSRWRRCGGGGRRMGCVSYPVARRLLITADGGGSTGSRNHLWKWELQQIADEMGLRVSVCHFPPGTSKWNKIEHRIFCHITENWRGTAADDVRNQVVVNLHRRTRRTAEAAPGEGGNGRQTAIPTGVTVTKESRTRWTVWSPEFHGEWNYKSETPMKLTNLYRSSYFGDKP